MNRVRGEEAPWPSIQYLIWKLKVSSVTDFGYCYYANAYRNVEDPRKRAEMIKEKHKMKDTNRKFRT